MYVEMENHWCRHGNGENYNGFKQNTESGLDCQYWRSQQPHVHPYTPFAYPKLTGANGYCRNPGGVGDRPWCYTISKEKRWEYCDIVNCGEFLGLHNAMGIWGCGLH